VRKPITLVRGGKPVEGGDFEDGDEIVFEVLTGEVITLVDKDGNLKWKSEKEAVGKTGRMKATR
jgi:hypothetical protein